MVFTVNIDSPRRNQVNIGNKSRPVDDPINLAVQAEPVASTIVLQAYQKETEHGIPITTAVTRGLFSHHSEMYCALSWNQPRICPKKDKNIPQYIKLMAPNSSISKRNSI